MKIRDAFATINGEENIIDMPSGGIEIVADDGRSLFCINLNDDGSIDIDSGMICKHGGKMFDTRIMITPRASNTIKVERVFY